MASLWLLTSACWRTRTLDSPRCHYRVLNLQFELLMKHHSLGRKLLLIAFLCVCVCLFPMFSPGSRPQLSETGFTAAPLSLGKTAARSLK